MKANSVFGKPFFFGPIHFYRDFFCKIEGDFSFYIFKGISDIKLKVIFFNRDFSSKIGGVFDFLWTFFFIRFIFKGISFVKLKAISFFWWNREKSNQKVFLLKGTFFHGDRYRVLSHPRYRPPTPALASEKWKSEKVIHFWSFNFFYFQICWREGLG